MEDLNPERKFNSFDRRWMWSLFGTAVGAGILFLPIRAGTGGFWPIVIMCIITFPMIWLSHRALARFVNSSAKPGSDITKVVEEHFGFNCGFAITILYFFAIYPICLAYGVGITNTINSFIVNQLHFAEPNRLLLAFICVTAMMLVMTLNETLVTKICSALVYPLCIILLVFSVYLIPQWKFSTISTIPDAKDFIIVIWLTLPVLVFSFNHSPVISTFALSVERQYQDDKNFKTNQIEFSASVVLLVFVMIFVFSCVMSLSPQDLVDARAQNIPVLSYFANKLNNPFISYAGPLVAFLAILTSFFGHYYGAKEGLCGIIRKATKKDGVQTLNNSTISVISTAFLYITIILIGYLNPSILGFIEDLGGPIIAAILFIMPIIAIYKVPAMAKFKNKYADIFVFIMGALTILSVVIKMIK